VAIALYELAGRGDAKISPHCWKPVYTLHHKELAFERIGIKFFEKDRLAFSGQKLVPVLQDGEATVSDSWAIADYLERAYPARPSLFGGDIGRGAARFIHDWTNRVQIFAFRRLFIRDAFDHVDPAEQAHYRATREARFNETQENLRPDLSTRDHDVAPPPRGYGGSYGGTLEHMQSDRDTRVHDVRKLLEPIRSVVTRQPFLAGDTPAYADYSVLGPFMWAKSVSTFALLEVDDPIYAWRDRMLHLFDGLGHKAGYPV
jgi:glutathione S-transferase